MENFLDERNAAYDKLAKSFLSRKAILAHILKNVVEEFADCSITDIEHKYIEGDPTATINTRKELTKMGGLMEPLLKIAAEQAAEKSAAETEKKSRLEDIRSLMETLNLTVQQAMNALKIPADKQKEYLTLI